MAKRDNIQIMYGLMLYLSYYETNTKLESIIANRDNDTINRMNFLQRVSQNLSTLCGRIY